MSQGARGKVGRSSPLGDVEVVATSPELLARVIARRRRSVAEDPARQPVRGGGRAGGDAFRAFQDENARSGIDTGISLAEVVQRGVREARGLASLWTRWTGLDPSHTFDGPRFGSPRSRGAVSSLVSVQCVTDAKGADLVARFADEDVSARAETSLAAGASWS